MDTILFILFCYQNISKSAGLILIKLSEHDHPHLQLQMLNPMQDDFPQLTDFSSQKNGFSSTIFTDIKLKLVAVEVESLSRPRQNMEGLKLAGKAVNGEFSFKER